jgi:hypothetical protein
VAPYVVLRGRPDDAGICNWLPVAVAAPEASVQLTVVDPLLNKIIDPVLAGNAVDAQAALVAVQVA